MIFIKKFLISILVIFGIFYIFKDKIVIPKEAIRIRVIANSNSSYDQDIKNNIKDVIEDELYYLLKDTKDINKARDLINGKLSYIDNKIDETLKSSNYDLGYNLNFGYNYFPSKEYKGIKYDEGMYESMVVTLGEGKGDNWWCVLFHPFCLIEAHDNNTTDIEYRWLIKDLINKYFG